MAMDPWSLSGGAMTPEQAEAYRRMAERASENARSEIAQKYKLGKDEISARLKIASQTSKDNRYGIDMERETAKEQIAQAREEMLRIGIPDMEIRRFVAESNKALAEAELSLRREIFLAENGLARDQLQLDREQMERIGIPKMEIDRYVAEHTAAIQEQEQRLAERKYQSESSGYMDGPAPLSPQQQARKQQLQDKAAVGAPLTPPEQQELGAYQQAEAAGGQRQATLEREKFEREYGLDVAKFGAELASTPSTYFQARRFQGVDVPRLMGGAGVATTDATGGPTPGVATMGAYLGGWDPYGAAPENGGVAPPVAAGGGYGPPAAYPQPAWRAPGYGQPPAGQGGGYAPPPSDAGTWGPPAAYSEGGGGAAGGMVYAGGGGAFNEGGAGVPSLGAGNRTVTSPAATATPYGGQSAAPAVGTDYQPYSGQSAAPAVGTDARQKQIAQVAKASPPSPFDGLDDQDAATLKLMQSIYQKGGQSIAGGEYERLKASGRLGYMQSAGRILGYDPAQLEGEYKMSRPSQGSASAY